MNHRETHAPAALRAAAILLPILCAMDVVGVIAYRRSWDPVNMRILVPGSVIGILLGTATFRFLDENLIRLLIGLLAWVVLAWRRDRRG